MPRGSPLPLSRREDLGLPSTPAAQLTPPDPGVSLGRRARLGLAEGRGKGAAPASAMNRPTRDRSSQTTGSSGSWPSQPPEDTLPRLAGEGVASFFILSFSSLKNGQDSSVVPSILVPGMAEGVVASGSGPNAGSRFWAHKQGLFGRPVRQIFLGEDGLHVYDRAGTAVKSVQYDSVMEASERPSGTLAPVPGTLRLDLARGGAMKFRFADPECSARFLGALKR